MDFFEFYDSLHIGEYLKKQSPEDREIQSQLTGLDAWGFIFSGALLTRDTVARTHGIRFEIRPKENGHNIPHCHAHYQGQEISISLVDCKTIAGNIPKPQQALAEKWVKAHLPLFQQHWDKYHLLEV